jgi:protein-tyrosine-phosphatase
VKSGGTAALKGKPIAPNAIVGLEETVFYPAAPHRARQMREAMIEEAEPVLSMTSQHVVTLHRLQGDTLRDVYALPEYAADVPSEEAIPDPYSHITPAYRSMGTTALRIREAHR